jgi:phage repressor protein C with HTH and peptisase S24 domain
MECNKITYYTQKEALQAVQGINKPQRKLKGFVRQYHCEHCQFWHLTSMNPKHYKDRISKHERLKIKNHAN